MRGRTEKNKMAESRREEGLRKRVKLRSEGRGEGREGERRKREGKSIGGRDEERL